MEGGADGAGSAELRARLLRGTLVVLGAVLTGTLVTIAGLNYPKETLLFFAAGGLLGLIIWRPQSLLVLYPAIMLTLPVLSREAAEAANTGIRADQLLLLLSLLSAAGYMAANRLALPSNQILGCYALYLLSFFVSICHSKFALGATAGAIDIVQFAGLARPLVILGVFMLLVNSVRRAWLVVGTTIATGAAVMAFGFAQLQQVPIVKAFTLAAYNRKLTLEEWLLFRRITATFDGQSNQAGFFGYMYAGLLAGLLLCMPREHLKRWGYVYAALLAASLYFVLGTGSRAALGGLIAAAGAVILLGGRRDLIFSATSALTVVIGLGVSVSDVIRNRLGELVDVLTGASIEVVAGNRLVRWQNAFETMFWPSPLFGSGPFRFTADSSYVAELCIRGILGLLIYCAFIIIVGRAAYITWKHGTHPLGRALGVCILVSTIGIALQGFTIAVLSGTRPAELWFLLIATMWLFYPAQKRRLLGREPAPAVAASGVSATV